MKYNTKMKKNLFLIIIFGIFFNACKNQDEKITIIDQLPLGVTIDTLNKEFEKRNLYDNYTTSIIITSIEQLRNKENTISFYYTDTFRSFPNQNKENIGLYYPITYTGTKNVYKLVVLLGHAKSQLPLLLGEAKGYEYMKDAKYLNQSINELLVNQIKQLYTEKYGNPISESKESYTDVYKIKDGNVEKINSAGLELNIIEWETEKYKIRFFPGLKNFSEGCYYRKSDKEYIDIKIEGVHINSLDAMDCYSFPYLEYELKTEVINKLELDKITDI